MNRRVAAVLVVLPGFSCAVGPQRPADVQQAQRRAHDAAAGTRVVLLGTGTPNLDPDRSGPALAVVVSGRAYLVDCGPGVVRRAAAARRTGIEALAPEHLTHVFITHLHSDHTVGYPDLIFSPWVEGRDEPLEAYGPPGPARMTEHIEQAYAEDVALRLTGLQPANPEGYKVHVHEIEPGLVYEDEHVRVTAFAVRHGSWKYAFGFRFDTPDRTIVISGDTTPSMNLIEHARGCDVLVHEVYCHAGFQRRPPEWQKYHASFHTSTLELAEIARQVRPALLVLTHQLFWGCTCADLLAEIGQSYDGEVRCGCDLDVY
jgi:ribonuclease BN (tRNA processing enzyme)